MFARSIESKHSKKILDFVKGVYEEFKFKKVMCDNGKEFNSEEFIKWAKSNGIDLQFSIPYLHESNGRVERVNRTIRDALKRTRGRLRNVLAKVIYAYNKADDLGLGMSPAEALLRENFQKVGKKQEDYMKEFGSNKEALPVFDIGQRVYIRNE